MCCGWSGSSTPPNIFPPSSFADSLFGLKRVKPHPVIVVVLCSALCHLSLVYFVPSPIVPCRHDVSILVIMVGKRWPSWWRRGSSVMCIFLITYLHVVILRSMVYIHERKPTRRLIGARKCGFCTRFYMEDASLHLWASTVGGVKSVASKSWDTVEHKERKTNKIPYCSGTCSGISGRIGWARAGGRLKNQWKERLQRTSYHSASSYVGALCKGKDLKNWGLVLTSLQSKFLW